MITDKNDTMKAYMQEIAQIPLVTREEEVDLAAEIAIGNCRCHDEN